MFGIFARARSLICLSQFLPILLQWISDIRNWSTDPILLHHNGVQLYYTKHYFFTRRMHVLPLPGTLLLLLPRAWLWCTVMLKPLSLPVQMTETRIPFSWVATHPTYLWEAQLRCTTNSCDHANLAQKCTNVWRLSTTRRTLQSITSKNTCRSSWPLGLFSTQSDCHLPQKDRSH